MDGSGDGGVAEAPCVSRYFAGGGRLGDGLAARYQPFGVAIRCSVLGSTQDRLFSPHEGLFCSLGLQHVLAGHRVEVD